MLSAANINDGLMLAFIMLISIILLIITGIVALFRFKNKKEPKLEAQDIVIIIFYFIGISGLLYSFLG
ncbi:hypothetical protein [Acinetobacter piscicola]|uniref:hypothetical protein n=1 Tax=Acinetobacter piscicola TaxID=2006115 RepID=UPI000B7CCD92|nr:hypothetical protein [Acinetobacter piscicola]